MMKKSIFYTRNLEKELLNEEVFDIIADYHEQNGLKKGRSMWNCLKDTYANISESIFHLFVETCPICQQVPEKKPVHKGAKNPIRSNHFRDRIQADLIDYRSDPKKITMM